MKDSHGSVELSSLSLASAINSKGIYQISAQGVKKVTNKSRDDRGIALSMQHKSLGTKYKIMPESLFLFSNLVESRHRPEAADSRGAR